MIDIKKEETLNFLLSIFIILYELAKSILYERTAVSIHTVFS